jgi:hypothetical protein
MRLDQQIMCGFVVIKIMRKTSEKRSLIFAQVELSKEVFEHLSRTAGKLIARNILLRYKVQEKKQKDSDYQKKEQQDIKSCLYKSLSKVYEKSRLAAIKQCDPPSFRSASVNWSLPPIIENIKSI